MNKIKSILKKIGTSTAFFVVLFLIGWALNGYCNKHFDLNAVQTLYIIVTGKQIANHGINSIFNSPKGQAPGQQQPTAQEREEK